MQFHDLEGNRLYLSATERHAFMAAAASAEGPVHTFCAVLHDTGCRISEALGLTPERIDLTGQAIVFRSPRDHIQRISRTVPVPLALLETLDKVHAVKAAQQRGKGQADNQLWLWSRTTAWRRIGQVMRVAGIPSGRHRSPNGLRYGYAAHAISSGVPSQMLLKWMGSADPEMTALHDQAFGIAEQDIAARMWKQSQ
jgi:integrase/recombinase XerD